MLLGFCYNLTMKRKLLVVLIALVTALLLWSLFGSFYIYEVVGQQCGPEAVVPCIMHDVTRQLDILAEHRTYIVLAHTVVLAILLAVYFQSKNR